MFIFYLKHTRVTQAERRPSAKQKVLPLNEVLKILFLRPQQNGLYGQLAIPLRTVPLRENSQL